MPWNNSALTLILTIILTLTLRCWRQVSGGALFVPNQTSPLSVPPQLPPISVTAPLTSAGSLPQPPSSNSGEHTTRQIMLS